MAGLPPLLQVEHSGKVCRCDSSNLINTNPMKICQTARHFDDIGRLITLAAIRDRRQKRTIRFNEEHIKGHLFRCCPQLTRFFESDNAGQGNVEAQIKRLLCQPSATTETVHDAGSASARTLRLENVYSLSFRFPRVNDC